jgi:hypothetical protein
MKSKFSILYNLKTRLIEDALINDQTSTINVGPDIVKLACSDAVYSYAINATKRINMLFDLDSIMRNFSNEDIAIYKNTLGKLDFSKISIDFVKSNLDVFSNICVLGSNSNITQAELYRLSWPSCDNISKIFSDTRQAINDVPNIICLIGNRQVGKDTFALHASRYAKIKRIAFADALKEEVNILAKEKMGIDLFNCTTQEKETLRPVLIAYGCAMRELNQNYWVDKVLPQIYDAVTKGETVIITDVRFLNELQRIYSLFGSIAVKSIAITNTTAPESTDEEKKHWPAISSCADHRLYWGGNSDKQITMKVKAILEMFRVI